jgi:branched-chain amino acid transport system substrate-binding protein
MRSPTRRELLALGGAAALAGPLAGLIPGAGAQTLEQLRQRGVLGGALAESRAVRIGVVTPAKTGLSTVATSINDYIGEGARMGALVAESIIGEQVVIDGLRLELLHANAPIPSSAERAVQRLVETGNLCALVGGVGDGQAELIAKICERAGLPFFNIGESADSMRGANCGRYTFHVEASAAMYLDAIVSLGAAKGVRRWFIMHENSANGRALQARAVKAVAKQGGGGQVAGSAGVDREAPVYYNEFTALQRSGADGLLLLTYSVDQIAILAQLENVRIDIPVFNFPDAVSQTRDYIATIRELAPIHNPRTRVATWESTLTDNGATDLNEVYMARWSEPVDPTAWASYASIKMIVQAVKEAQSVAGPDLVRYFERQDVTFDVMKGPGVNFRPWDHQLRQPLYAVDIDQVVEWVRIDFTTWVALGKAAGEIRPTAAAAGANVTQRLDQFGDGPADTACRMPA